MEKKQKEHEAKTESTFKTADHLNKPKSQKRPQSQTKKRKIPKGFGKAMRVWGL